MANQEILDFTELTTPADDDVYAVVDISDTTEDPTGTTKKIQGQNVVAKKIKTTTGPTVLSVGAVADGEFLKRSGSSVIGAAAGGGGLGDVVGPASATDNALTRFDGTTGKLVQDSTVTVDDNGAVTVPEIAAPGTPAAGKVVLYAKADGLLYSKDDAGTETVVTGGGGGGTPGGSDTQVQFNDAGAFGGDTGLTFAKITNELTATGGFISPVFVSGSNAQSDFRIAKAGQSTPGITVGTDLPMGFADAGFSHVGRHPGFLKVFSTGSGSFGTFVYSPHTRAQFTANQNDLDIPENHWLRWSSDASRDITGMRNETNDAFSGRQADGETHLITNVGSSDIVLKHESVSSVAANRFLNSTAADITLSANQAVDVIYDGTTARWRVHKRN